MGIAYNQNRGMAMLKVNGKDVIFSKSFVMKPNDQVSLKVPEIIARDIKIITSGAVSSLPPDAKPFYVDEADDRSTVLTIPFADVNGFVFELAQSQFATVKGPVSLRMSSLSLGATAMLVHIDVHEGRYDNYVEPGNIEDYLDSGKTQQ
jgi:hypothetical protein